MKINYAERVFWFKLADKIIYPGGLFHYLEFYL